MKIEIKVSIEIKKDKKKSPAKQKPQLSQSFINNINIAQTK